MVLESTMICFDNAEDMRNGDFTPTRLQAQKDGANLLIQCKLRSNPENSVGLLSMADRVNVLSTLTNDSNKLFIKLHDIQPKGSSKFLNGSKIAHLALKHRQNRNHKPRIILFVGSAVEEEENQLVASAKKFKKEKVSVDIVCFGDQANANYEKLKPFLETLNGKDGTGSHMIAVPSGSDLQQALMTSPIVRNEDGSSAPVVAGGGGFFDVDPNEDPELALVLRVSLEEQRARQEQEAAAAAAASAAEGAAVGTGGGQQPEPMMADFGEMTEEQQIALALQMSLEQHQAADQGQAAATGVGEGSAVGAGKLAGVEPMDTEERSKSISVSKEPAASTSDDLGELMSDPNALQQLLSTLPGVDPNSEAVQQAVAQAKAEREKPNTKKPTTDGKEQKKQPCTGKDKEKKKEDGK